MNILSTQYTLQTRSLEIYVAGCSGNPHCTGCHNPETWRFDIGDKYDENYNFRIKQKINVFEKLIDNIMIFGGEPLDQKPKELLTLLSDLSHLNKKIWLFTRYDISDVPKKVKELCDYIKCGRYIPELIIENNIQFGIKLATSNQKIYKKGIDYESCTK